MADSCSDVVTAHKVCEHMLVLKVQILVWAWMHVCLLTLQVSGSATVWLHMQRWKISSQHSEQLPRLSDTRKFKKNCNKSIYCKRNCLMYCVPVFCHKVFGTGACSFPFLVTPSSFPYLSLRP